MVQSDRSYIIISLILVHSFICRRVSTRMNVQKSAEDITLSLSWLILFLSSKPNRGVRITSSLTIPARVSQSRDYHLLIIQREEEAYSHRIQSNWFSCEQLGLREANDSTSLSKYQHRVPSFSTGVFVY